MSLLHRARLAARRFGVDVQHYPESDPLHPLVRLLDHAGIGLVLDVGANDGGYARTLRRLGYRGRIFSFEPISQAFARLQAASGEDSAWEVRRLALSDRTGTARMHVAGNEGHSSSLLPMRHRHVEAAPTSATVGTEVVELARLDDLWDELDLRGERVFLKLDVQGAEAMVLDGAEGVLDRLVGLQVELSFADLYEGQPAHLGVLERLHTAGFAVAGLVPGFSDPVTCQLLQADGVFFRTSTLH